MSSKLGAHLRLFQSLLGDGARLSPEAVEETYASAKASLETLVDAAPVVSSWLCHIVEQYTAGNVQDALSSWKRLEATRHLGHNIGFLVFVTEGHPERDAAFFRDLFDLPGAWDDVFENVTDSAYVIRRLISLNNDMELGKDKRWLALSGSAARSPDPDYPYPMVRFRFQTPYGQAFEFVEDTDDFIDNIYLLLQMAELSVRQWPEHIEADLTEYVAERLRAIGDLAYHIGNMLTGGVEGKESD